jgi:hypothetical protein
MNFLRIHWQPTPQNVYCTSENVFSCVPQFTQHASVAFSLFLAVGAATWFGLRQSTFWGRMGHKTHATMASYALSTLHHVIAAPLGLWAIRVHALTGVPPWRVLAESSPWSVAYLAADFIVYAIPTRDAVFALHHFLGLALSAGLLFVDPALLRWVPLLYVCEFSSFGMCLSYVLRKSGHGSSALATVGQAWFVLSFFAFRIVNFCTAMAALFFSPVHEADRASLGPALMGVLALIAGMQLYWFYKILLQVGAGLTGGTKKPSQALMTEPGDPSLSPEATGRAEMPTQADDHDD